MPCRRAARRRCTRGRRTLASPIRRRGGRPLRSPASEPRSGSSRTGARSTGWARREVARLEAPRQAAGVVGNRHRPLLRAGAGTVVAWVSAFAAPVASTPVPGLSEQVRRRSSSAAATTASSPRPTSPSAGKRAVVLERRDDRRRRRGHRAAVGPGLQGHDALVRREPAAADDRCATSTRAARLPGLPAGPVLRALPRRPLLQLPRRSERGAAPRSPSSRRATPTRSSAGTRGSHGLAGVLGPLLTAVPPQARQPKPADVDGPGRAARGSCAGSTCAASPTSPGCSP